MKRYWETIRDNLTNAGWRCGSILTTDHKGRQIWVVAAEREDAGRFIVHADEMLTALVELELAIRPCGDCAPTGISAQKFPLCRQEDVCIQCDDQTQVRFS